MHRGMPLEKLAPELLRRLQSSRLAAWRGSLLVTAANDQVLLLIDRSRIDVIPARESKHAIQGGEEIAQLIIRTKSPDEIVEATHIKLTGDAGQLIEVLFPNQ